MKAIGAGRGYMIIEGIFYLILGFAGIMGVLEAIIPFESAMAFLLFIGLTMGSQAFQASPVNHAPAVIVAFMPQLVSWANGMLGKVATAAGSSIKEIGNEALVQAGIKIYGLTSISAGSIVTSVLWGAIAAHMIDKNYKTAGGFALVASALSYIGFIHSPSLKLGAALSFAGWYLALTALLYFLGFKQGYTLPKDSEAGNFES